MFFNGLFIILCLMKAAYWNRLLCKDLGTSCSFKIKLGLEKRCTKPSDANVFITNVVIHTKDI